MSYLEAIHSKLITIPSHYPNEKEIGLFLERELKKNGFSVERQEVEKERYNLLAEKGQGKTAVLFYAHMDTVPISPKEWKTDPYTPIRNGEYVYGSGASDDKGGIAAVLSATKNTKAHVKIAFGSDEENISKGAWAMVKKRRGFFKGVELIISAEPSFLLRSHNVTRGRTGRCVFVVTFKGKSEHLFRYKSATDAIEKMGNFIAEFYKRREKLFKSRDTVSQVRMTKAESIGMSVCGEATAEVEVLLGNGDSIDGVKKIIETLSKSKVVTKPRETPYLEGYYFDEFPYMDRIDAIIKRNTGKRMVLSTRKSVADDNVFASLNIPVITWGAEGANEHKANERVNIGSLKLIAGMYTELLDILPGD